MHYVTIAIVTAVQDDHDAAQITRAIERFGEVLDATGHRAVIQVDHHRPPGYVPCELDQSVH